MTKIPDGLRYSREHEWAKVEEDRARVGITDHAQSELTDVVYVELPATGRSVGLGEPIGVVESVKAVSEILAPVSGKVVESNDRLADHPELVNKDPYGDGWIVTIEMSNPADVERLMDAAAYRRHIGE